MNDRSKSQQENRLLLQLALLFLAIICVVSVDLIQDLLEGVTLTHSLLEGGIALLGLIGLAMIIAKWVQTSKEINTITQEKQRLNDQLQESRQELLLWKTEAKSYLEGLGEAIERQFSRWQLTSVEAEVALLLLKGFSHKEIAQLRNVRESTTRQQAQAAYKKAKLNGRHELSAFFLEDLMLPQTKREPSPKTHTNQTKE